EAVAGDVAFVAELDGLLARDVRLCHPGRSVDLVEEAEQAGYCEEGAEDTDFRDRIGAAVEDLHEAPTSGGRSVHKAVPFSGRARVAISCVECLRRPSSGRRGSYMSTSRSYLKGPPSRRSRHVGTRERRMGPPGIEPGTP